MKKGIILMLALSVFCSMTACGNDSSSSEKEKTTSASAEVVSETDSSAEDSSSTESVVVTKKEEPESSKSDSSDEGKDDKGDDEDELPDNFLDIIPLADPKNQVSGNGTITDATIADSLEEGIQAFENLDAYSKVVRVDENSTYDSLKAECDDKSLIVVTFDVTKMFEMNESSGDYSLEFNNRNILYQLQLGNQNDEVFGDFVYAHFANGDKNTTVIGKADFEKNNTITIIPYAVCLDDYLTSKNASLSGKVIAYSPTFCSKYSFAYSNLGSDYYTIRKSELFVEVNGGAN